MAPIMSDQPLPHRSASGMTTRAVNTAAGVLHASMKRGRQTPTGLAIDLDSARLLNSPETAAEHERLRAETPRLRARVAELEQLLISKRTTDEDPIAYALTDKAEQLPAEDDVTPQVRKLQALLAGQRAQADADGITRRIAPTQALQLEDPHDSPLHHDYRVGRDLPEVAK